MGFGGAPHLADSRTLHLGGRRESTLTQGVPRLWQPAFSPTTSKKASQAARKAAAAGFLASVPLSKVQAFELLKGDLYALVGPPNTDCQTEGSTSEEKRNMHCVGNGLKKEKAKDLQAKIDQKVENLRRGASAERMTFQSFQREDSDEMDASNEDGAIQSRRRGWFPDGVGSQRAQEASKGGLSCGRG